MTSLSRDSGDSRKGTHLTHSDRFLRHFSRVTSSGRFIPEIDGFRFIAIASVFLFHLGGQMGSKSRHFTRADAAHDWLAGFTRHGDHGVPLFFVISGFILGLPFAVQHLMGGRPVNIREFYFRRLTRLEPPYILALLLLSAALLLIKADTFRHLLPHLLASIFYLHNLTFGQMSTVDGVAWSLEVEIQFYLLAPVLALLFTVRDVRARRGLLIGLSVLATVLQYRFFFEDGSGPVVSVRLLMSLAYFIQYFLVGFLLADIYVTDWRQKPERHWRWDVAAIVTVGMLLFSSKFLGISHLVLPWLALALYVSVFRGVLANAVLTNRWLTTIGGMCYSIYLLHFPIISLVYRHTQSLMITHLFWPNLLLQSLIVGAATLAVSGLFFVVIEKPCMRKDWPTHLLARLRGFIPPQGVRPRGKVMEQKDAPENVGDRGHLKRH